jgi:hypothetical protein
MTCPQFSISGTCPFFCFCGKKVILSKVYSESSLNPALCLWNVRGRKEIGVDIDYAHTCTVRHVAPLRAAQSAATKLRSRLSLSLLRGCRLSSTSMEGLLSSSRTRARSRV